MKIGKIFLALGVLLVLASYVYFVIPVFAFSWFEAYFNVAIIIFLLGGIAGVFGDDYDPFGELCSKIFTYTSIGAGVVLFIGLLAWLLSSVYFVGDVNEYRSVLGKSDKDTTKVLSADLVPFDITNARVLTEEVALTKVSSVLNGDNQNYGSVSEGGYPTIQAVNGRLFCIIPLLHIQENIATTLRNADQGTVGYVKIPANDINRVQLVDKKTDGKPIRIVYQPNALGKYDLERHLRSKRFRNIGLTDVSFEEDDSSNVWWVVTTYKNVLGVSGIDDATGVVIVNPETGELNWYAIKDVPAWVDRVYPESMIHEQINYFGKYVNKEVWFKDRKNAFECAEEKLGIVYGKDGRCYYFTGLTSLNSDKGTIGFYLIDTRTKAVKSYSLSGFNEKTCLEAFQGSDNVKAANLTATYPSNLESVSGMITYFSVLVDESHNAQKYGFVSVQNTNIYGVGSTVQEALMDFNKKLSSSSNNAITADENTSVINVTGVVDRIGSAVSGNGTIYYIRVDVNDSTTFQSVLDSKSEIPVTKVGDKVSFTYRANKTDVSASYMISNFDNLMLKNSVNKNTKKLQNQISTDSLSSVRK